MRIRRAAAVVMAALLACVLVCSLVLLRVEAHHDCSGEHCPVCAQLAVCRNAVDALRFALVAAFAVTAAARELSPIIFAREACGVGVTPVSSGVRMLN